MEKMIFVSYVESDPTKGDNATLASGEYDIDMNLVIRNQIDGDLAERIYEFLVSDIDRTDEDMLICYIYDDEENDKYKYEMKVARFDPTVFTTKCGDLSVLSIHHFDDLDNDILKAIMGGNE